MKNLLLLLIITFSLICCEKDTQSKPIAEIDKLPPATQIGANTFGCLLDGKAFKPDGGNNSLQCFYQVVNYDYYFYIRGTKHISPDTIVSIYVVSQKKQIFQGETYDLFEKIDGNVFGSYAINLTSNTTSHLLSGKTTITKLDPINYIVSGTFWYDIIDYQGVKHEIREGRFDMHYTN